MADNTSLDSKNWENTCNRFVAFFDIMGFKDFVARRSHEEVYSDMYKITKMLQNIDSISSIDNAIFAGRIYSTTFSDSIILFSKDDSIDCFSVFSLTIAWLFKSIIKESFPIKGAIAHGKITINKSNQIYFGQPLIDAFELQNEVLYYGIIAHHTVEKYLKLNPGLKFSEMIYFDTSTPLKLGDSKHYNIDWFNYNFNPNISKDEIRNEIIDKIENFRASVSGSTRRYIDNSHKIISGRDSKYGNL